MSDKTIIVIPGYNVANVLPKTIAAIPAGCADEILLVDDGSSDETGRVAAGLGITVLSHARNRGYGAAQKTGYCEAIGRGAGVVVLLHGDNQYDPSLVPTFVTRIRREGYDVVTGTRMALGDARRNGMPFWKYVPNRLLTRFENWAFKTELSDYHDGYRAFSTGFLKKVPLHLLSDSFDFDTDIIVQAAIRKARIGEVPHPTRYLNENSQMPFAEAVLYGLRVVRTTCRYLVHQSGLYRQRLFMVE
jgi:glycosyltransferase involved in cell wall biosynthesis